jgi:REP element-mobilizing transposase RayT
MSMRLTPFAPGEYYHVYNRGNDKRVIFHDEEDNERFISLLFACNDTKNLRSFNFMRINKSFFALKTNPIVRIGAYCLMPNHFHILITLDEFGDVSKFMQKVNTAYVMYYNKKYNRTGSLFEGKFKSEYIDNDRYLKYIFSYIHLNPIKLLQADWKEKGIKDIKNTLVWLQKYPYSSYQSYVDKNHPKSIILNKKTFPKYFPTEKMFTKEILDWLRYITVKTSE